MEYFSFKEFPCCWAVGYMHHKRRQEYQKLTKNLIKENEN